MTDACCLQSPAGHVLVVYVSMSVGLIIPAACQIADCIDAAWQITHALKAWTAFPCCSLWLMATKKAPIPF